MPYSVGNMDLGILYCMNRAYERFKFLFRREAGNGKNKRDLLRGVAIEADSHIVVRQQNYVLKSSSELMCA
jgi:hypothetical protein